MPCGPFLLHDAKSDHPPRGSGFSTFCGPPRRGSSTAIAGLVGILDSGLTVFRSISWRYIAPHTPCAMLYSVPGVVVCRVQPNYVANAVLGSLSLSLSLSLSPLLLSRLQDGCSPMQMVLSALGACACHDFTSILTKQRIVLGAFTLTVTGQRSATGAR